MSPRLLLAAVMLAVAAPSAEAAELRSAQHAGAACYPYPQDVGIPYSHQLYGFRGSAFCPIRVANEMQPRYLHLVFVYGINIPSVRLCVHREGWWVRCGPASSIGSRRGMTWVTPPTTTPGLPSGAYLSVTFPRGVSLIDEYDALWSVPD